MKIPSFGEEKLRLDRIWGTFLHRILHGTLETDSNTIVERFYGVVLRPIHKAPEGPK